MKNILLLFIVLTFSCQQSQQPQQPQKKQKPQGEIFQYEQLGWSIELPVDWKVIDKVLEAKKIKEIAEEAKSWSNLRMSGKEKILLKIEKDEFNYFQATVVLQKDQYEGEWKKRYANANKEYITVFKDIGANVDIVNSTKVISGVTFDVIELKISEPMELNQKMYRTYFNDQDLVISMLNTKTKYRKQLEDSFLSSTFQN